PRHLIWVCNEIASISFEHSNVVGHRPRKFSEIVQGLARVRDDIAEDVLSSYANVYPNARGIFNFLNREDSVWPRASHLNELAPKTRAEWPDDTSYSVGKLLEMASHLGIVGKVVEETDEAVHAEFEYLTGENLNLNPSDRCAIHPMFHGIYR